MVLAPTGWVVLAALAVTLAVAWRAGGRELWREHTADRLLYGVPWGTLLTVGLVVAFYLAVQWGATDWSDPLTLPFRTWSYLYPTGLLTAGVAHNSPSHLLGNMAGTVAFGVVAEIAWGHYPPAERDDDTLLGSASGGLLTRPWVRALVVVPAAMLGVAVLTSLFSLGATLGFSGAVFAIAGFAVVTRPLAGVLAVVGSSAVRLVFDALSNPVVRATVESGPPSPPAWARIAFQAHMLGFVVGVVLAVALLRSRRDRPATERVFFGTLAFGLAQSLWLISWPGGEDTFVLYRGAGVVFVLLLTGAVTVAATGSDRRLLAVSESKAGLLRILAGLWLALLGLAFAGIVAAGALDATVGPGTVLLFGVLIGLLALPAVPAAVPRRWGGRPLTRRGAALGTVLALGFLLAALGGILSPIVVDGGSVTDTGEVAVDDYTVTYGENVTDGRSLLFEFGDEPVFEGGSDGLIVVSERRQIWTIAEDRQTIAHEGNVSVVVGGVGSRTVVHAERTGWAVTGNDSAYAVDLRVAGETTRSFESERVWADVRLNDHRVAVEPVGSGFEVRVARNGTTVATAGLPAGNETVTVGSLQFSIEEDGEKLVARSDGSEVTVAERETF